MSLGGQPVTETELRTEICPSLNTFQLVLLADIFRPGRVLQTHFCVICSFRCVSGSCDKFLFCLLFLIAAYVLCLQ